ncbi:hypothetical protein RvY_09594-3 [Ramazzottius varieornatus]|uniref:Uncharacterized protein n=1 Tax=Ramazzottius varieornatus TaxID=947166 RepID=A0A1D1VIY7_RAMVA|nr:hypothetical protein RvY_09594-3 [Ramazzottius varieornatus]
MCKFGLGKLCARCRNAAFYSRRELYSSFCWEEEYSARSRANRVWTLSTSVSSRSILSTTFCCRFSASRTASSSSKPSFIKICRPRSISFFFASGYSVRASHKSSCKTIIGRYY